MNEREREREGSKNEEEEEEELEADREPPRVGAVTITSGGESPTSMPEPATSAESDSLPSVSVSSPITSEQGINSGEIQLMTEGGSLTFEQFLGLFWNRFQKEFWNRFQEETKESAATKRIPSSTPTLSKPPKKTANPSTPSTSKVYIQTNPSPNLQTLPSHGAPVSSAVSSTVTSYLSSKLPATGRLPTFSAAPPGVGKNISCEVFLRRIEKETNNSLWNDTQRMILAKRQLVDIAQERWFNQDVDTNDWATFKKHFIKVFSIPREDRERYFEQYAPQRTSREPLQAYMERVYFNLNNFHESGCMPEADKLIHLRRILKGLLPRELLLPLYAKVSFSEMLSQVELHAEHYRWTNLSSDKINVETTVGKPQTSEKTSTVAATTVAAVGHAESGQGTASISTAGVTSRDRRPDVTCQFCSRHGHTSADCRFLRQKILSDQKQRHTGKLQHSQQSHRQRGQRSPYHTSSSTTPNPPKYGCYRCGGGHRRSECEFRSSVQCQACNNRGHTANVCRIKNGNTTVGHTRMVTAAVGTRGQQPVTSTTNSQIAGYTPLMVESVPPSQGYFLPAIPGNSTTPAWMYTPRQQRGTPRGTTAPQASQMPLHRVRL